MAVQLSLTAVAETRPPRTCEVPQKFSLDLVGPRHSQRADVENTIAQRFADVYGADIKHFMPTQLCMTVENEIVATVGIRRAQNASLFLENYFDRPIEQFASRTLGCEIRRSDVVEIGNLASIQQGGSQWLFVALTLLLCDQNQPWVTFTATPEVQKLLRRLNIQPLALTGADAERLGTGKSDWGNYYQQQPVVMITHAPTAKRKLMENPIAMRFVSLLEPFVRTLNVQWQAISENR
jgi:hypothetical protein